MTHRGQVLGLYNLFFAAEVVVAEGRGVFRATGDQREHARLAQLVEHHRDQLFGGRVDPIVSAGADPRSDAGNVDFLV